MQASQLANPPATQPARQPASQQADVHLRFRNVLPDVPSSPPAKLGNLGENPNKKCFGWFTGLAASGWEKILRLMGANALILKHWFFKLFKEMPPSPHPFLK